MPLSKTKSIPDLTKHKEAIEKVTPSKQVKSPKITFDDEYFKKKNIEEQLEHYGDRQRLKGTNGSPDQKTVMRYGNKIRQEQRNKWNEKKTAEDISFGRYPQNYPRIGLQVSPLKQDPYTPPYIKKTKSNQNISQVDPDENRYYTDVINRITKSNYPGSPPLGGKSKRRKSKTKSCCSVRKSAKVCRRKTDNKKFRLPRRFSRKTCLAKKPRGFTMRSSCAPYKGCKKTRKGGTKEKKRRREEEDDDIFHLYDNPVSANFMSKLFENTDHLSEKDAGIYRENMEKEMIKKAKKLISNLSVEQEDMLLKLSKKIEEESRGGRKK